MITAGNYTRFFPSLQICGNVSGAAPTLQAGLPCLMCPACIFGDFRVESSMNRSVKTGLALYLVFDAICGIIGHASALRYSM
jgi:hypothetical protein